ncbi:MAG: DinB family protein [Thermoanaerobaculia bacterium]
MPAFETGNPSTGGEIRAAAQALHGEIVQFLGSMSIEAFFARQGPSWSPAWHVRHLTKANFPVARALRLPKLLPRLLFGMAPEPSRSFDKLREDYRARLAAGGQAGRFAPSDKPLPPNLAAWRQEIVAVYESSVNDWIAASRGWSERKLDRVRLPHPLLGKLTVREMLFFTLYHNAHHMAIVARRLEECPRMTTTETSSDRS